MRMQQYGEPPRRLPNEPRQHNDGRQMYMPPKHGRLKRVLIGLLCVLCALFVGVGVASAAYYIHVSDQLNRGDKSQQELDELGDVLEATGFEDPFYMMLIGSDARSDDPTMGARSDTNIVVRVDATKGQLTLVSIPRDTRIDIPGHGTNKFNAAYAFGKAPGVIDAAEKLLDIDISHYAEVNFEELIELVDAVGGVDIEVDELIDDPQADLDATKRHNVIEAGMQHLDGQEALAFARSRAFAAGDFTRSAHQRQLIEAIVDEVLSAPLTQMPGIIEKASACVTTDLKISDLLTLANLFKEKDDITMYSAMLPSTPAMIGGVSYVINNEEATAAMMKLVEKGEDPNDLDLDEYPMPAYYDEGEAVDDGTLSAGDASGYDAASGGYLADDDEDFWSNTGGNELYEVEDDTTSAPDASTYYDPGETEPGTTTEITSNRANRF